LSLYVGILTRWRELRRESACPESLTASAVSLGASPKLVGGVDAAIELRLELAGLTMILDNVDDVEAGEPVRAILSVTCVHW